MRKLFAVFFGVQRTAPSISFHEGLEPLFFYNLAMFFGVQRTALSISFHEGLEPLFFRFFIIWRCFSAYSVQAPSISFSRGTRALILYNLAMSTHDLVCRKKIFMPCTPSRNPSSESCHFPNLNLREWCPDTKNSVLVFFSKIFLLFHIFLVSFFFSFFAHYDL